MIIQISQDPMVLLVGQKKTKIFLFTIVMMYGSSILKIQQPNVLQKDVKLILSTEL